MMFGLFKRKRKAEAPAPSEAYQDYRYFHQQLARRMEADCQIMEYAGAKAKRAIEARLTRIEAYARSMPADASRETVLAAIDEVEKIADSLQPIYKAMEKVCEAVNIELDSGGAKMPE